MDDRHSRRPRSADAGFTLIELLVVVLVIGVLAAIAVPVFLSAQDRAVDSTTTSDLVKAKIVGGEDFCIEAVAATGNPFSVTESSGIRAHSFD